MFRCTQVADVFPWNDDIDRIVSCHVETVCLLINQNAQAKHYVNVGLDAEEYYQLKTK